MSKWIRTKEYVCWGNIKQRCYNVNHAGYKYYGGRGITMSKEFYDNYEAFSKYLKTLPNYSDWLKSRTLTVDRIDNDKGYVRGNIRFASKLEQIRNRRYQLSKVSGCYGVYYDKSRNKWKATICVDGRHIFLGRAETVEGAALLYDNYIVKNKLPYKLNNLRNG